MPAARTPQHRVVALLSALVVMNGVLLAALAVGAVVLWREYGRVRGAVVSAADGGGVSAREVVAEVSRRQQVMSTELAAMARDATRQVAEFERRAAVLRTQGGGPIANASRAVEMTQLMADEMLLQLKFMITLDSVMEKASRPLPPQFELLGEKGRSPDVGGRRQARDAQRPGKR